MVHEETNNAVPATEEVRFSGTKNGPDGSPPASKKKKRKRAFRKGEAAEKEKHVVVEEDAGGDSDEEEARNCCLEFTNMSCSCDRCADFARDACSVQNIKRRFPITQWLPKYSLGHFQGDLIAGMTVGLMVIPQGLAYSVIAELPPQYGLYSAFMGCFIYTFLGTSKDITLGPTAIMSLMTAAFAASPVEGDPTYAIILSLFTGIIQVLMGVLHLGFLVRYISYPVINAFTSAAAITIACGQIKNLLGLHHISREFMHMIYETCEKLPETNLYDMTMGLVCIVILTFMKYMREFKCLAGTPEEMSRCKAIFKYVIWLLSISRNAVVVIVAALFTFVLIINGIDVLSVTGKLKPGLPDFEVPKFYVNSTNGTYYGPTDILSSIGAGFVIVPILGLVETIAIGKAFARKNNYKIKASQELIAMGFANVVGSFVQAYPVTGSFSRTAVNSQSGVKTPAGGVFTGIVVLLALGLLTPWFYYIPDSALAAVIMTAVVQMIDISILKRLWTVNKLDLIPWTFTFVFSFVLGIEFGILIGIGVSLIILLFPQSRPGVLIVDQDIVVIQLDRGLQFPGLEFLSSRVQKYAFTESGAKSVVVDCTHISTIDYTVVQGLQEICDEMKARNVQFILACVKPEILDSILRAEVTHLKQASTVEDAIKMIYDPEDDDEDEIDEDSATEDDASKPLAPFPGPGPNNIQIHSPTNGGARMGSPTGGPSSRSPSHGGEHDENATTLPV